jgi:CTP:molybdopterin cytidylyltransferase MocA
MRWSEFEREADVHVQKQKVINETMLPARPAPNDFKENLIDVDFCEDWRSNEDKLN